MKELLNEINDYINNLKFNWFNSWQGYTSIRFNKYKKNKKMAEHCDHIQSIFDGNIKGIPILSVLGILNNDYKILDMTAGCGGNMISFCEHFKYAVGVENNITRYTILEKNMLSYNYTNYKLICGDSLQMIDSTFDVFFIDPPWGGPEYKKNEMIELYLSNINLKDIILMIPKNKLIVLKLPYNYNTDYFKDSPLDYNIIKKIILNNIIILFISMI